MLNRAIKILQPAASESREMAAAQDLLGRSTMKKARLPMPNPC